MPLIYYIMILSEKTRLEISKINLPGLDKELKTQLLCTLGHSLTSPVLLRSVGGHSCYYSQLWPPNGSRKSVNSISTQSENLPPFTWTG